MMNHPSLLAPVVRVESWLSRTGRAGIIAASALGALLVWLAATYDRSATLAKPGTPGMSITGGAIELRPEAPQWHSVSIGTVKACTEQLSDPIPAYVRIDETRAARVGAPLGGRVVSVDVEIGQSVAHNTPLFTVSSPELAALGADRDRAKVELDTAHTVYDRTKAMVQVQAVPAKDELTALTSLRSAELSLSAAQSKLSALRVAQRSMNEFVVRAPRAGTIVEKNVLSGQEVGATDAGNLITIADLSSVWVVAEIFETDAQGIVPGARAEVVVPSATGSHYNATLDMVSSVVDPERHSLPIRLRLDNPDGRLRPNSFAQVRILVPAPPGAVDVPATALVSDGEHQSVLVETSPRHIERRRVTAGAVRGGRVVITQGLVPGDRVVERGALLLDNALNISG